MVWGGISIEGCTDLYRLDNGTQDAIRYLDEILGPIVRPHTGAVGPGFLLAHDNARPHVARLCRQFLEDGGIDTIEWPPNSPDLNPIKHLWDIMFRSIRRRQVAPRTQSLVLPWSRSGRKSPGHHSSSHKEHFPTLSSIHTSPWGPYKLLSTILNCCNEISAEWAILLHHFFNLHFRGVFRFSPLYDDHFHFH